MKLFSKWMIVTMALTTPIGVAAQSPSAPGPDAQGPGMEMQQRRGPEMGRGMEQGMGQRGQRGMKMREARGKQFMRQHHGMMLHRMLQNPAVRERLRITPEQMTRLQAQESTLAKSGIRSRAELQVKRMELAELMRGDTPDRALIDKKLREVQDASFAAEKARIDGQLNMHELFTPEQRQEMEKMRGEFRGRMMRRGPDGQGPGGPRPMGPRKAPPSQNPPPGDNSR